MWKLRNLKTSGVRFIAENTISRLDADVARSPACAREGVHVATPSCAPVAAVANSEHLSSQGRLFFSRCEFNRKAQARSKPRRSASESVEVPIKYTRSERGLNLAHSHVSGGWCRVTLGVKRAAPLMTRRITNSPIESNSTKSELAVRPRGEILSLEQATGAVAGKASHTMDAPNSARPSPPLMPTSFYARARSAIRNRPIRRSQSS